MATAGNVGGLLLGLLAGLGQAIQARRLQEQTGQAQQMALLKDSGEFLPASPEESAQARVGQGLFDRFMGRTPEGFFNVGGQLTRFERAQPLPLDMAKALGLTTQVPRQVAGPSPFQSLQQGFGTPALTGEIDPGMATLPSSRFTPETFAQGFEPTTRTVLEEQVIPGLPRYTSKERRALAQKFVETRLAQQQRMISGDRLAEINPMFAPFRGRMIEEKLLPLLQEELKDQRKRGAFDEAQQILEGGGSVQEAAKVLAQRGVSDSLINNFLGPQLKVAEQKALIPLEIEKQKALLPGELEKAAATGATAARIQAAAQADKPIGIDDLPRVFDPKTLLPVPFGTTHAQAKTMGAKALTTQAANTVTDLGRAAVFMEEAEGLLTKLYAKGGVLEAATKEAGLSGRGSAAFKAVIARIQQSDPDYQRLVGLLGVMLTAVARNVGGERGQTTEQDVERVRPAVAAITGLPDTKETALTKMRGLRNLVKSINRRIFNLGLDEPDKPDPSNRDILRQELGR